MLYFVTGVPGSGKTYYAVYQIWDIFIKNHSTAYNYLYTNIANFKFGISPQFKKFNFSDFDQKILELYDLYKSGVDEYELIEFSKKLGLYKLLFVLDEAHNFFDKEKPHLVFFLTYHRHFYCDLIFITQNLLLIHYKYRYLAEFFIKARNKSISLNKTGFSYSKFIDDKLQEKLSSFSLPSRSSVFQLYHSGDSVRTKNFLFIYIFIVIIVFLLLFFSFIFIKKFFFTPSVPKHSVAHSVTNLTHPIISMKPKYFKYPVFGNYVFIQQCNKYILLNLVNYDKILFYPTYSVLFTKTDLQKIYCHKRVTDGKKNFSLPFSN